jgi:predicted transcriptional regulator of viral defense system
MKCEKLNKVEKIFKDNDFILKTAKLREYGLSSRDISELLNLGYLIKIKTGYYGWKSNFYGLDDYELVQRIIPHGIISVFTAAEFHGITTVNPVKISVTITSNKAKPILPDYPPIEIFYTSEENINMGIISFEHEGRLLQIYNKERTVCDFFKYINRVGNDIAMESLKNYMSCRDKNLQLLFEYAKKLRVIKYIKPYVEALL